MEALVNKIFSDEPKRRKRTIIKPQKKEEKNENLSILIMSEDEESESDNKNKLTNEIYKQLKGRNKGSCKNLIIPDDLNINHKNYVDSPKPKKLKKEINLNKTSLLSKKNKKKLNESIENKKIEIKALFK